MKTPTVSIIIPTLNADSQLRTALESIRQQTFPQFEVLILDGGSTDRTVEIAKSFAGSDNRFRLLCEKDNGIYDAMNKGIRYAGGDWLFFMGSDDCFYNEKVLEKIAGITAKEEGRRFIYGNVRKFGSFDRPADFTIYDGEFTGDRLLRQNICHQAIFYHRSVFSEFGNFNTRYRLKADWDFNLRCFNKVNPLYCDMIITNFFGGGSSARFEDSVFHEDLLENLIVKYPYDYRNKYFTSRRRHVARIFSRHLKQLHLVNAYKASRVLLYNVGKRSINQNSKFEN